MSTWTPRRVEGRLAEAASVLQRLPAPRRLGYFSTWPAYFHAFSDLVGQQPQPLRISPSPAAISRMEETLDWTVGLDPIDGTIVWQRAYGVRWKTICWTVGRQRSTVHERWLYALCVIALQLNCQSVPKNRSRHYVIDRMRDAASARL